METSRHKIVLFLYLILLPFINIAQTGRVYYYNGNISLNGNNINVNGNSQLLISATLNHDVKTEMKKHNSVFDVSSTLNYTNLTKNGTLKLSDDIIGKINPRIIHKNWSIFNYVQASSLYSRRIDLRLESAIGGGFYWINNEHIQGTIAYAAMVSRTDYNNGIIIDALRHSPRAQIFLKYKNINSSIEMYYQPMMSDHNNYNYNYTFKFSIPVHKSISLNITDIETYESFTLSGISSINSNLSAGITIHY